MEWPQQFRSLMEFGNEKKLFIYGQLYDSSVIRQFPTCFSPAVQAVAVVPYMKDYLTLWHQELLKLNPLALKSKLTVIGEQNKHHGPRWSFARIQISFEPAQNFEVIDLFPGNEEARRAGYIDWVVFGLLDVLLLAESSPLKNVRITLERAEVDALNSSQMAFRHAGRDAARKLLQAVKENALASPS